MLPKITIKDPFFRGIDDQQPSRKAQQAHRKFSPKVVSVPVHFVSSEQPRMASSKSRESAALHIQRIFRGFLVRKSVKKISSINIEVCEVKRRINDIDVVELIRRNDKERLRVNETLMTLLLQLDSIRGVDIGVRDFRKAVIKKAIALQERVDSVVASKNEYAEIDSEKQLPESAAFRDEVVDDSVKLVADWESGMKVDGESGETKAVVKELDENFYPDEVGDEFVAEEKSGTEGFVVVHKDEVIDSTDDNKRNIQLLEKMMDDNEKMMTLMTQMSESNKKQTWMLNSLCQRVEQLEKVVFMCDKPRRKKRPAS